MGKAVKRVHVHTHIGDDMEGVIVELDPYPDDLPSERDMAHLPDEQARELYDQLGSYFASISEGGNDA